ncbi:bacteriorhodopsin [Halosimplex sp. J119]
MLGLTTWFTIGTLGMVVGTAMLAYGLRFVPSERRRQLGLAAVVPAIAAVAYAVMALGFGGLSTGKEATVFVPRYLDWLLTTPVHVAIIALVVGASTKLIARLVTLQALTIVFGFVGATLGSPLNWVLYLAGSVCFAGVVYLLFTEGDRLADESADDVAALFRKLRSFVVVLWLVYPVIWVLAPAGIGVMDVETAALVVTYIDVVAKVGFGLILINDFASMVAASDDVADVDASIGDGPNAAD